MGQPNGKYAVFSTIVDDFILLDATRDEYIEFELDNKRKDLEQHIDNLETPYPSWDDAIRIIELVHGKPHVDEILNELEKEKP